MLVTRVEGQLGLLGRFHEFPSSLNVAFVDKDGIGVHPGDRFGRLGGPLGGVRAALGLDVECHAGDLVPGQGAVELEGVVDHA